MAKSTVAGSPQSAMTDDMDPEASEFVPGRVRPELAHIDTTVTRGVTRLTASSGRNSASTNAPPLSAASLVPPPSTASSLFTHSIWSPQPKTDSAKNSAVPRKPTWETYMNDSANLINHKVSRGGGVGLGLNTSTSGPSSVTTHTSVGEKFFQNQASTGNYVLSPQTSMTGNVKPAASTFPLTQTKFTSLGRIAEQPRISSQTLNTQLNTDSPFRASKNALSQQTPMCSDKTANQLQVTDSESASIDSQGGEGNAPSVISEISPHYLELHPELKGLKGPVVRQATHPRSFKQPTMDDGEFDEAFEGALQVIGHLNPDYIGFPYGTRVINIKTDFVENIHHGVNASSWSTLEAVSRRIMGVWDARKDPSEKVFFLFAVNGSKSYCALAEMKGRYDTDGHIEGWRGSGHKGVIPVQWLYVKNVSYTLFTNIFQTRNNQPVVNMWNGMNIDSDTGRRVIETYVGAPHLSNALVWKKYSNPLAVTDVNHNPIQRGIHGPRGGRGRGGFATIRGGGYTGSHARTVPAIAMHSWRDSRHQSTNHSTGNENEPLSSMAVSRVKGANTAHTPPHLDGSSDQPPSTVVACVMNADGTYTPVQTKEKEQQSQQTANPPAKNDPRDEIFYQAKAPNPTSPAFYPQNAEKSLAHSRGGGFTHRGRGGFASRGVRGSFHGAHSRLPYSQAHTVLHNGHIGSNGNTHQFHNGGAHDLHHVSSGATIRPQSLRSVSSASSQQSQYPHSQLRQRHSATSVISNPYEINNINPVEPPDPFIANYTIGSSGSSNSGSVKYDLNEIPRTTGSEASYPGHFQSADSLAGFDARRAYKEPNVDETPTAVVQGHDPKRVFRQEADPEQTPTHVPMRQSQSATEKVDQWHAKTPGAVFTGPFPPNLGLRMPSFSDMKNMNDVEQAEMYELLALGLKARAANSATGSFVGQLPSPSPMGSQTGSFTSFHTASRMGSQMGSQMGSSSDGLPTPRFPKVPGVEDEDSFSEPRTRGSSEADSTVYETPSVEGYNVSPLRDQTGRILKSASKHGSPAGGLTRRGARALNAPYEEWPSSTVSNVNNLVNSPSSSIMNNIHTSPSKASNVSELTMYSRDDNDSPSSISDGSRSGGGIRLEG